MRRKRAREQQRTIKQAENAKIFTVNYYILQFPSESRGIKKKEQYLCIQLQQ